MNKLIPLTSFKPHLVRAYHAWFTENELRPYVMVEVARLPIKEQAFFRDQPTVLVDLSLQATRNLEINLQSITGLISMGGEVLQFIFPMEAILGIYAEGTELGELFVEEGKNTSCNCQTPSGSCACHSPDTPEKKRQRVRLLD